jgi:transaldolase
MQIFLDTASIPDILYWKRQQVIDGVTTNPSILYKAGFHDLAAAARELAAVIPEMPLSVEVASDDPQEMVEQGRECASWAPNIVVKIPVLTSQGEPCFEAMHTLRSAGIPVNATAILSFGQAILAAKAGATYVSIFAGRIADEGNDPAPVIGSVRRWLDLWRNEAKIIAGSIRGAYDVQQAACAGAHVVTVPPALLAKFADHRNSRATAAEFLENARRSEAAAKTELEAVR